MGGTLTEGESLEIHDQVLPACRRGTNVGCRWDAATRCWVLKARAKSVPSGPHLCELPDFFGKRRTGEVTARILRTA